MDHSVDVITFMLAQSDPIKRRTLYIYKTGKSLRMPIFQDRHITNLPLPCGSRILISFTWLQWFGFRLEPVSGNDRATPKIVVCIKRDQK